MIDYKQLSTEAEEALASVKYDLDYFIKKFESLKDEEVGKYGLENKCALYHCGAEIDIDINPYEYLIFIETISFAKLLYPYKNNRSAVNAVYDLNDHSKNPRQTILNKLYELKSQK